MAGEVHTESEGVKVDKPVVVVHVELDSQESYQLWQIFSDEYSLLILRGVVVDASEIQTMLGSQYPLSTKLELTI